MNITKRRELRRSGKSLPKREPAKPQKLVGDIMYQKLHRLRIPTCDDCLKLREKMNRLGPNGCRAKLQALAEQMHRNATNLADNVEAHERKRAQAAQLLEASAAWLSKKGTGDPLGWHKGFDSAIL